jgi:hypothetical protein
MITTRAAEIAGWGKSAARHHQRRRTREPALEPVLAWGNPCCSTPETQPTLICPAATCTNSAPA